MAKFVYTFGDGKAEGDASMRDLLGGKGANLAEMCKIGLPVPAGFTITTEVCVHYYKNDNQYPAELKAQVDAALAATEATMGTKFGDASNPMLLACRSGSRDSMPGMMDTVLNIGLNDVTVEGLAKKSGNRRFALDSYRRLIEMYGNVVMGMKGRADNPFEDILHHAKAAKGVKMESELGEKELEEVISQFKSAVKRVTGKDFPTDPQQQIWGAAAAVFGSWMNDRATVYRRQYGIPDHWGTAVNIMAMVFGNLGDDCATGVALTRDGSLGHPGVNGDYLINAQGEDVVNGSRPTERIEITLGKAMPKAHAELVDVCGKLERHYRNMQDIEFTVQAGKLWMLQTRNAKRTGFAAVRVAVDLVKEGLISKEEAISARFIPAGDLEQLLAPIFNNDAKKAAVKAGKQVTKGIPAGPGGATGKIVLDPFRAEEIKQKDPKARLILVREETTPEDLRGMKAALGIVTSVGGVSSHAALVSRQMGKVCVVSAENMHPDYGARTVTINGKLFHEGDDLSVDGFTGEIFAGAIETKPSEVDQVLVTKTMAAADAPTYKLFEQVMAWAEEYRTTGVRTNADDPKTAQTAIAYGAEGIGLCRTEHMFFEGDRITYFRRMILAEAPSDELTKRRNDAKLSTVFIKGDFASDLITEREKALIPLLKFQRDDFAGLFRAMGARPVTIRLLDPPLHEFLPHVAGEVEVAAGLLGKTVDEIVAMVPAGKKAQEIADVKDLGALDAIIRRATGLHEANPMLGHRGCRLGIVFPEITAMQARAIFEAAVEVKKEGVDVHPEVMVPLAGFKKELSHQKEIIDAVAAAVFAESGVTVDYLVGTMIEIPRAAIRADDLAGAAEFFSFGTNDLTQTGLGISRDDYGPFINPYTDPKKADILPKDPFVTIDQEGIGELMKIGVERGRKVKPNLKIGICGEHGGEPESVKFCHRIGLNYVSCSPNRVPVAKLALAQAALEGRK